MSASFAGLLTEQHKEADVRRVMETLGCFEALPGATGLKSDGLQTLDRTQPMAPI